jgi:hypothetical protein
MKDLDAITAEIFALVGRMTGAIAIGDMPQAADIAAEMAVKQGEMKELIEDTYGPNEEMEESYRNLLKSVDGLLELVDD